MSAMPALRGDAVTKFLVGLGTPRPGPAVFLYSSAERRVLDDLARSCGASGVIEKTSDERAFRAQLDACIAGSKRP
jgi:hypothetical protein